MGPLDGLRVLSDARGIGAQVAGMLLADFGADVVRVEPPDGDPLRGSPGFAVWNRGSRSVRDASALLQDADVVIVSGKAPHVRPECVVLRVPEESNALLCADLGVAFRQTSWADRPVDSVYPHVLYAQGLWAAACAVAALVERERSGLGQAVTVDGRHAVLVTSTGTLVVDPRMPARHRPGGSGGPAPFYRPYRCADGEWLFLAALTASFYMPAFDLLGVMDIFTDERLGGEPARMLDARNIGWVLERIASVFETRTRDEWLKALSDAGVPAGPLLDRDDWLDHPQVAAIGARAEVDDPERGRVVMPGMHLNLTLTPGAVRGPAPRAGEHEGAGWLGVGHTPAAHAPGMASARDPGRAGDGPLAGVRVLDLGAIIAGPYAGSLLRELGADVVKVEPVVGDSFRGPGFVGYNKGQRSLPVDLRDPDGRAAFLDLVATADVVIDNYRPGVLERLRIAHDDLAAVRPDVVSLSITGFGVGGPLGGEPGFDPVLQSMSGMMRAQGGADDPVFFTMPVNDVASAATAALGACLALYHRARSGDGQHVWTSLAGTSTFMQSGELVRFAGRPPARLGSRDHPGAGDGDRYYETSDGFVRVEAPAADPALLESLASRTTAGALAALRDAGAPAAAARRVDDLPSDDGLLASEFLHRHDRAEGPAFFTAGRFARFSRTQVDGVLLPPGLGEHARDVLRSAGLPDELIDDLVARGVVAEGGPIEL